MSSALKWFGLVVLVTIHPVLRCVSLKSKLHVDVVEAEKWPLTSISFDKVSIKGLRNSKVLIIFCLQRRLKVTGLCYTKLIIPSAFQSTLPVLSYRIILSFPMQLYEPNKTLARIPSVTLTLLVETNRKGDAELSILNFILVRKYNQLFCVLW